MTGGEALAAWLTGQRWFAGKARRIAAVAVEDRVPLRVGAVWLARVVLDDGSADRYALPVPPATVAGGPPADGLDDPAVARALLDLCAAGGEAVGERGRIRGERTRAFPAALPAGVPIARLGGEQSNTSLRVGDALVFKHFRRLVPGEHPEAEIGRFLTERTAYAHAPRLAGVLEYRDAAGAATLGVVQELVAGGRDGWEWMLARLAAGETAWPALGRLGRRTAELHLALASDAGDPAFAPEPITPADVAGWTAAVERQLDEARRAAGGGLGVPDRLDLAGGLAGLVGRAKTRHHGDFHLGQTLRVDARDDFVIIDFEGEPLRPLAERRRKHTPLRDVAGLLRSLGYAAAAGRAPAGWEAGARRAFLEGYRAAAGAAPFLAPAGALEAAAAVFEVEKAAYEVVYEASHRPDWLAIPLGGLVSAAAALRRRAAAGAP